MPILDQKIIDTHHHLWDPTSKKYDWLVSPGHEIFNNVYLLDNFTNDFKNLNVIKSVHVQGEINLSEIIYETKWLQQISDNNKFPNAIVGFVDFLDSEVEIYLNQHLNYANFRGIRQILNFDKNNKEISHAKIDYLKEETWVKNFSLMQKYDLSFDLSIFWTQTEDALKLINKYNNVLFIINHTLSPINIDNQTIKEWHSNIKLLSNSENVVIKLSGFGEFNSSWDISSIKPLILNSIEAFGTERCMFGSNFPVDKVLSSAKYEDYWIAYYNIVKDFSSDEKDKLFYLNAEEYYKI
tara:strand:- start:5010 stop:5897 length:888 start_codon:yes stop_codon:yes gene_type:complete